MTNASVTKRAASDLAEPTKKQRRHHTPSPPLDALALTQLLGRRGYVVVPSFLTTEELAYLRDESAQLLASPDEHASAARDALIENGCVLDTMADCPMGETARARVDRSAYLNARTRQLGRLGRPSSLLVDVATTNTFERLVFERLPRLITSLTDKESDEGLFFFNEHYVVKPPHSNVEFRWHRDDDEQLAMCIHRDEIAPYVSAWCALDDISLENGPLQFVGYDKLQCLSQDPSMVELEALASERIVADAGTVVLFFSNVWHFSSSNTSSTSRRAFYAQYSWYPITATSKDSEPLSFAIPCSCSSPNASCATLAKQGEA